MIMLIIAVTITAVEFVEYCGFNWTIQILYVHQRLKIWGWCDFFFFMFLKEAYYVHQSCIYLKNTVKTNIVKYYYNLKW